MFKNEAIDICMHCFMPNLKKNAQVCVYFLAGQNIDHCIDLTFFEGKLCGSLMKRVYKSGMELKTILI